MAGPAGVSGGALVAAAWAGGADLDSLVERAAGHLDPGPAVGSG